MKKDFNLEEEIQRALHQEEALPESIQIKTQHAYKEVLNMSLHKKKSHKKKWVVAASLLTLSLISLQAPLFAHIKERFFNGSYKGVAAAIEEGHLQNIVDVRSESNGITLEVVGALVDPTVIHLRLRLSAQDPKHLKSFKFAPYKSQFVDQFTLIDDQGRVIQEVQEDGVYTPPFMNAQGESVHLLSSSSEQINTSRQEQGEILFDLIFNSSQGHYADIKGLTLQSQKLNNLEGNWVLHIPFTPDMLNQEATTYTVLEPNPAIEITSAVALTTGIQIDCILKVPVDEAVASSWLIGADGTLHKTGRAGWMEAVSEGERVVLTFEVLEKDLGDTFTVTFPTIEGTTQSVTLGKVTP